uniref:HUN domain-containing protein n=1 Tax=Caenorhabditis tropicalis TaxID=1561998 RepID=A0A1I7U2H6_9PELO
MLGVGLDEQEKEAEAKKKKRGGGGISKVKWSDDPIVFYEIGDDFDRFEGMDNDVTVGSSSVMTASIKEI